MKSFGFLVWVALLIILPVAGMSGEFYQYQDHSGSFYYTDDSAGIPENKLPEDVNVFTEKMTVTEEPQSPVTPPEGSIDLNSGTESQTDSENGNSPGGNDKEVKNITADQLDAEKDGLDQLHRDLQAEEAALSGQSLQGLTRRQLNAYEQKIMDLNARIEQYKQQQKEFQSKVEGYNAWIKSKEEKDSE